MNVHALKPVGTDEQKKRWLDPLVAGETRLGFSMTEPMQGGGGNSAANVLIVMARTASDVHPYVGCSLFLVPADTPGVDVVHDVPHVGGDLMGVGHAEITYDNVRVPAENLLVTENEGFTHAQQRLGARAPHALHELLGDGGTCS